MQPVAADCQGRVVPSAKRPLLAEPGSRAQHSIMPQEISQTVTTGRNRALSKLTSQYTVRRQKVVDRASMTGQH
jgi:hypothetical protein